jgi:aminoglycoside phosphotransferase (APT) family kinase protein
MTDMPALLEKINPWLARQHAEKYQVKSLQSANGGYSNITLVGELTQHHGNGPSGIVVRIQPEGAAVFPDCDVRAQYQTMHLLKQAGMPVPSLLGLEMQPSVLGAPFFVMSRVEGQVPNENPLYHLEGWFHDLKPEEIKQCWFSGIEGLGKLAKLDWQSAGFQFLLPPQGQTALEHQIQYYKNMLRWSEQLSGKHYALLDRCLNWLVANQPNTNALSLSWGDAKLGNCVFQNGQLTGMLDWERPALSNPVDDLSWWLMLDQSLCTGYGVPRLAHLPSREETIAHWEKVSGFSAEDLHYYDVFSAWRFAIIMTRIGRIFTERGWVPVEAEMDLRNGGSRLVEMLDERLHF